MVEESMARAGIEEMELDESNPPRDDFLWWSYHVSGENPRAWQVSAQDLLDGAMAASSLARIRSPGGVTGRRGGGGRAEPQRPDPLLRTVRESLGNFLP